MTVRTFQGLDSPDHDGLLGELDQRNSGVMADLGRGLWLFRSSCAELPTLLYPADVVEAIQYEAAQMQWAERKAGMAAKDEVVELRDKCLRFEIARDSAEARASLLSAEVERMKAQIAANPAPTAPKKRRSKSKSRALPQTKRGGQ